MISNYRFRILDNLPIEIEQENLEIIVQTLINEIKVYLELDQFYKNIKFKVINKITPKKLTTSDILIIEIYDSFIKFLPFILLRELYNLFVPPAIKK